MPVRAPQGLMLEANYHNPTQWRPPRSQTSETAWWQLRCWLQKARGDTEWLGDKVINSSLTSCRKKDCGFHHRFFRACSEKKSLYFYQLETFLIYYFVNSHGKTLTQEKISSRLTFLKKAPFLTTFFQALFPPRGLHCHQLGLQPSRHFYAFSYIVWFCKVLFYQYIKIIHIAPQYAFISTLCLGDLSISVHTIFNCCIVLTPYN